MFDEHTGTMLSGDLFSQPGREVPPVTTNADAVWQPSEAFRVGFPYASLKDPQSLTDKLAAYEPEMLACMHGSSYRGDGASLLRKLGDALAS
jgi:hypothetical protein